MKQQNRKNHTRYYAPHHFVFYPVVFVLLLYTAWASAENLGTAQLWGAVGVVLFLLGWLSFMLRQHYALTLQNRIVLLEFRLRYYQLTQKPFEEIETRLSFKQVAALRFASDGELLNLIEKTLTEDLPPDAIKKEIRNWKPDYRRV